MTTQTARPATTGKRGIQLNQRLFTKAIAKARQVKPRVVAIGSYYGVMMSDQKTMATVHFAIWDGAIWATCTCKAHTLGDHNQGKPVPCYHIAAAAEYKGAARIAAKEPRLVIDPHHHLCPRCGDAYDCDCPTPELNQVCQDCDVAAFDAAQQRHNAAIERTELEAEILRRWEIRYPHKSAFHLRGALLQRFGVSTLEALPIGTLQDICQVL